MELSTVPGGRRSMIFPWVSSETQSFDSGPGLPIGASEVQGPETRPIVFGQSVEKVRQEFITLLAPDRVCDVQLEELVLLSLTAPAPGRELSVQGV